MKPRVRCILLGITCAQHGRQVLDVALGQPQSFDLGQLAVQRLGGNHIAQRAKRRVDTGQVERNVQSITNCELQITNSKTQKNNYLCVLYLSLAFA